MQTKWQWNNGSIVYISATEEENVGEAEHVFDEKQMSISRVINASLAPMKNNNEDSSHTQFLPREWQY